MTTKTPLKFVVDVTFSLTLDEIAKLKKLADLQSIAVEEAARRCMNEDADYMLHLYDEAINVPN